jgi:hypothetical protein
MGLKEMYSARISIGVFCSCHDEFDSANCLDGIPVDHRQISRRETLEFGFPPQPVDFHAQNSILETQSAGSLGNGGAAYNRPCHQRSLGPRSQAQRPSNDFLQP